MQFKIMGMQCSFVHFWVNMYNSSQGGSKIGELTLGRIHIF